MLQIQETVYFIDAVIRLEQLATQRKTRVVHSVDEVTAFLRSEPQLERVEIVKTTISSPIHRSKFDRSQTKQNQVSIYDPFVYNRDGGGL